MKLVFPFPPSVNGLYSTNWKTKRRFKSKRYADWEKLADQQLKYQTWCYYDTPVSVTYLYGRPDKRVRDLPNLSKGIDDLLVRYGILTDDSLIHEIHASWGGKPGFVEVEIKPLAEKND